ncbi:hypothetical protein, partial [Chimaeribacter arupi]|uniref:hypothetical protein n=1 Tax=Chimaeribacter arupi TaxID=2060066 RepID=UPI000CB5A822
MARAILLWRHRPAVTAAVVVTPVIPPIALITLTRIAGMIIAGLVMAARAIVMLRGVWRGIALRRAVRL